MKLKTVLSACAICFCSIVGATTFDTNLGNFNPLNGSWSYKSHGSTETFDDVYTFNALTALTLDLNINGEWGTVGGVNTSFDGHTLSGSHSVLNIEAGEHKFSVHGLSDKYGAGYNAHVTAVPEPLTTAMLLSGLGVIGLVTRKRKNT